MNMSLAILLYFAYGSNLLTERIHIDNPSAVRKAIGVLHDYRLDFNLPYMERWGGCPATIVPDEGKCVWGAIWELDSSQLENLDRQEGVEVGFYFPLNVTVETDVGTKLNCRTYQLTHIPEALHRGEELSLQRQPSKIYLEVIIKGAIQSGLPSSYIEELKKIPNNGNVANKTAPISLEELKKLDNYIHLLLSKN